MARASFEKQSWETWIIAMDISDDLEDGETILLATSSISAVDKDGNDVSNDVLDSSGKAVSGPLLQIRVFAGDESLQPYKITFRAVTSLDNKYELDVKMVIREK